ncbi:MAG: sugar phosphate nucleotidyltransferase [Candidatus Komeilibacteria bacterium]|nr:sugar phosphate nucleotidyltransferase [Candidatus Komeilibacteria bacterium]
MYVVILAGGHGTRLWPLSRKNSPKQVQPFLGKETLLQMTWQRLRRGFTPDKIFVAAESAQKKVIKEQLPDLSTSRLFLEPERRDTAAAIGLATWRIASLDPAALIVVVSSDAYIDDQQKYLNYLRRAEKLLTRHPDNVLLIAFNPTYAETGYGYIKLGSEVEGVDKHKAYRVDKFVEKPSVTRARTFLKRYDYLWNSGMFIFRAAAMKEMYKSFLPTHYRLLEKMSSLVPGTEEWQALYKKMPAVSVDYGIMEKADNLIVLPADFSWCDIGSWRAIKDIMNVAPDNITRGKRIVIDQSENNLIYNHSDRVLGVIGLKDSVIINTADATLICAVDKAQDIKKLLKKFKDQGLEEWL